MAFGEKIRRIDFVGKWYSHDRYRCDSLRPSQLRYLDKLAEASSLLLGFLALFLFAAYETSDISAEPVMPPRLFTNRTSVIVSINTFLNSALLCGIMFFLPVYFQGEALDSRRRTGVSLLPQSLIGIPGAAISAMALSRWGKFRLIHLCGFALFTLALGVFSLQREDTSTAQWAVYQCVFAFGAGMVLNILLPSFQAPASETDQAAATSTWCFIPTFEYATIFDSRVRALVNQMSDASLRERLSRGSAYQSATAHFVGGYPIEVCEDSALPATGRTRIQWAWCV
jgi:hypothetical protein